MSSVRRRRHLAEKRFVSEAASALRPQLPQSLQRAMDVAEDKGASQWLSALPLAHQGVTLHTGAFRHALCLRYDWRPSNLPSRCVCGQDFSIDHAMICPTGGFPTIRHNEVRDITATLLRERCAQRFWLSPFLNPCLGKRCAAFPPTVNLKRGSTLALVDSGVDDLTAHFLIWGFFIRTRDQIAITAVCHL